MRVAVQAVKRAGAFLQKHFMDAHTITQKAAREEASEADLGAEKIVLNVLHKAFPTYSVLSEEKGSMVIAREGKLHENMTKQDVIEFLNREFANEMVSIK